MGYRQVALSRVVTHALRHAPEQYGIVLDAEGWTDLDTLVQALRRMPQWARSPGTTCSR